MSEKLRFSMADRTGDSVIKIPSQGGDIFLVDGVKATAALEAVRSDDDAADWVLFGYADQSSTSDLVLMGSGDGGVDELKTKLTNSDIAYGLIRFLDIVDDIKTTRYAYLTFFGDDVGAMRKASTATNKAAVTAFIGTYSVEVFYSDVADIDREVIFGKVQDSSGSKVREINRWPEGKAEVSSSGSGSSGGNSSSSNSSSNSKPVGLVPTENQDTMFENPEALADVRSDSSDTNWALYTVNNDNKSVRFEASGSGGLEELQSAFDPNEIQYAFLRQNHLVDGMSNTVKFLFVSWVGENVRAMRKGRVTTLRGSIVEFFEPYTAEIQAVDLDDIAQDVVDKRLQEKSG